jgi:osmotically-inducible protein OsmY
MAGMRDALLSGCLVIAAATSFAQEAGNLLGDPFVQVTAAMPSCPVPRGPYITTESVRKAAHGRTQQGGSCYRVGRCRLPNAYLYDREIIPRVSLYIREDGRFADTSVWVLGQARTVTLLGCVQSQQQADELERAVALVDDVLGVANLLMIGTQGAPRFKVVGDTTPDY